MPRRDQWRIRADILVALRDIRREAGAEATLSAVATRANLPYDRLVQQVEILAKKGLVTRERVPAPTPQGLELLREYEQWRATMERFDL